MFLSMYLLLKSKPFYLYVISFLTYRVELLLKLLPSYIYELIIEKRNS